MSNESKPRRDVLKGIGAAGAVALAGCSGGGDGDSEGDGGAPTTEQESIRAAFAYVGEVRNVGWTAAHDNGRLALEEEYEWVETEFSEGVGQSDASATFSQWAEDGVDVVFGTTFEHMDPMFEVSEQYPDTVFEHCSGFRQNDTNMGRYYGRRYQPEFLCGVAAGHVTETDTLGYIAPIPIPEIIRQLNSFAVGASTVNDSVSMEVRWINAWEDPSQSRQAASALVDEGADVVVNHLDSAAGTAAAADEGAWAVATNTPMPEAGGDNYLGSAAFDWGEFYKPTVEAVHDGEYEPDWEWLGLDSGVAYIDMGDPLPDDVVSDVETKQSEIMNGERTVWQDTQFAGWSDPELFGEITSYVSSVEGSPPE